MKRQTVIDWIEATTPEACDNTEHLLTFAARATNTRRDDWYPEKRMLHYRMGVRHASGVRALSGREGMGTHVIASGSALAELRKTGQTTLDFLSILLDHDARPTRIDLAIDAIDSGINFLRLMRQFRDGKAETKASTWYLVQSAERGWTLYIGAPQSDKHMRIYNKHAEVKHKATCPPGVDDWVRFELVLMRQWARRAARVLDRSGEDETVRSFIRSFAQVPHYTPYSEVLAGSIVAVGVSSRKITDTRKWLLSSVPKAFGREAMADPTFREEFFRTCDHAIENARLDLAARERIANGEPLG